MTRPRRWSHTAAAITLCVLCVGLVSITGFIASATGTMPNISPSKSAASGSAPSRAAPGSAMPPAPSFEKDILPLLKARCFECHSAPKRDAKGRLRKPKGDLRFDGLGFIRKAQREMDAIVPGAPGKSLVLELVRLPASNDEAMPPKGDRLTPKEIAKLEQWIAVGAPFGDWRGAAGGDPVSATGGNEAAADSRRLALLYGRLAKGLSPAPKEALAKLATPPFRVESVAIGNPLLRVGFPAHEKQVDDETLKQLEPIAGLVVQLDLGRTQVSDSGLKSLNSMPRLVRLDLTGTQVTSTGLRAITRLPELRSLILVRTAVDDRLDLSGWPQLRSLYLMGSQVTDAGLQRLRDRHPKVTIRSAPNLPPPAPANGDRRRRRG